VTQQRIRLFISGKVQGVFFRQALKVIAIKNDVYGWVRNLSDGRVEALIEGKDLHVNAIVEWAHRGSANARVDDIEIKNEKYTGEFSSFEVLY